jgi:hypothetical protein
VYSLLSRLGNSLCHNNTAGGIISSMSETALKAKRAKAKRRLDSAIQGGTFVSQRDLENRWGCNARTASTRIKAAGLAQYLFSEKSIRYKLSDVETYERQVLARGFEHRAAQLRHAAQS